ncbi:MAG: hypothetical protein JSU63_04840 [Phycisphaerales bacterium]|nr:MAG: hypothetical protein JSU63_04840 [Phycisphaerales bacterium]
MFVLSLSLMMLGLYGAVLYRVTRSYIRHLRAKPGTCNKCGYSLAYLTEARCPECGLRFDPEELPEGLPIDVPLLPLSDWKPPEPTNAEEKEYAIDCASCGCGLSDLGEEGVCVECGVPFRRRERLFDLYGPEVFLPDAKPPREHLLDVSRYRAAMVLTVLAVVSIPIMRHLSEAGIVPFDRWVFVLLLFVAAGVEWIRASSAATTDTDDDES